MPSFKSFNGYHMRYFIYAALLIACTNYRASAQRLNEDSIKRVIKEAKHDTTRIDAMLEYAGHLINHELDSAGLGVLREAKALSEKNNYPQGLAQIYLLTGNFYRDQNEWEKSMEAYRQLIAIAPTITNEINASGAY
jgi:tetratricopeptide (TPR) repeat protein